MEIEHDMIDKEKKEPSVNEHLSLRMNEFGVTHIVDTEKEGSVERYFKSKLEDDDIDKFGE